MAHVESVSKRLDIESTPNEEPFQGTFGPRLFVIDK